MHDLITIQNTKNLYLRDDAADDVVGSASCCVAGAQEAEDHCTRGSVSPVPTIPWLVGLQMARPRCLCQSPQRRRHRRFHSKIGH